MLCQFQIGVKDKDEALLKPLEKALSPFLTLLPSINSAHETHRSLRFNLIQLHSQMYMRGMVYPVLKAVQTMVFAQADVD